MLGLSCGIDYGLFILSRHRTNLLNGMTPGGVGATGHLGTAGSAVVFAALTVIIALCGLDRRRHPVPEPVHGPGRIAR